MDDLKRLVIERACARLVVQYCHFIDHGEAARVAELFCEDGVWASPENTMTGRAAILKGFTHRQNNKARMSRHVCDNLLLDVVDDNTAEGVVYLTLYRHDGEEGRGASPAGPPELVGEYRDRFRNTADGWRFERREIFVSFAPVKA